MMVTQSNPEDLMTERVIGQAPGQLALVQAFVNTADIEASTDELTSPTALAGWLAGAGLLSEPAQRASQDDLALALGIRETLRAVLRAHAGHGTAGPAAAQLGSVSAGLSTQLVADPDGRVRVAAAGQGIGAALARLLLIAAEAGTAGTWARLKACGADDCQWAFYDRSPTRNGCWCSMQICGSRAKSRAYRRRAAAGGAPTASRSGHTAGRGA